MFKEVLKRISIENTSASAHILVARASFLINMFHGGATMSRFHLARVFSPSLLGILKSDISKELMMAHKLMCGT